MKLGYALLYLCLCACGSASPVMNDAAPTNQDAGEEVIVDAGGMDEQNVPYNPCVKRTLKASKYPRLQETWCTDSNGTSYTTGYLDTQLNMTCRWRPASDMKVRCLPKNEQSAMLYSDSACIIPMGLVESGSAPYIGVDVMSWVVVYQTGNQWSDTGVFYIQATIDGEIWDCTPAYFKFPKTEFHYLKQEVDPTLFVEQ